MPHKPYIMQPTIIGLDPATHCGWAAPWDSGAWDLSPDTAAPTLGRHAEPEQARCGKLWNHLQTIAVRTQNEPVVICCESAPGFNRFPHTLKVGHELRGVIKAACYIFSWNYLEVPPTTLKKFATGSGKASKKDMVAAAMKHNPKVNGDDEADAIHLMLYAREQLK